jgi:hypothetical protein
MKISESFDLLSLGGFNHANRFKALLFALCAVVVMLDGLDTKTIGIASPAKAQQCGVGPLTFGLAFRTGFQSRPDCDQPPGLERHPPQGFPRLNN